MKRILGVLLVIISLFSLSSCQIEDTNGSSNYSLVTITNDDIINGMNTSSIGTVQSSLFKTTKYSAKKFSGVKVIDSFNLKGRSLKLTVDTELTKGNARFVVIYNNKIVKDFAVNGEKQVYSITSGEGTVLVKVAGESASLKIVVDYDYY